MKKVKTSVDGLTLIRTFEGFRPTSYKDQGSVWTIGFGHTKSVSKGMTCTIAQAEQYLADDLLIVEACINSTVKVPLKQCQFDALASFTFNLGCMNFVESTLRDYINMGRFVTASEQFPKWNHIGKVSDPGLLRRRLAEQKMFNGAYNGL